MKGLTQYLIIFLVIIFIMLFSFYLFSQLLSKEEEVSVISRKISSIVDKMEYSKIYFIKMIENEYSSLKGRYSQEEIPNRLEKRYKLEIDNIVSTFEIKKFNLKNGEIEVEVVQSSKYDDSAFQIEANKSFVISLR